MEMTFPHPVSRTGDATRQGHQAMLAAAIARQANSRTARAVSLASRRGGIGDSSGDAIEQRIHYFGSHHLGISAPSGPFGATRRTQETSQVKYENGVYQDASRNSKAPDINGERTGEQFNHAGHGALRTL